MEDTIWKTKSLAKTKETKELKKRIKELKISRDLWKEKFKTINLRCFALETSLKKTKILIEKIALHDL